MGMQTVSLQHGCDHKQARSSGPVGFIAVSAALVLPGRYLPWLSAAGCSGGSFSTARDGESSGEGHDMCSCKGPWVQSLHCSQMHIAQLLLALAFLTPCWCPALLGGAAGQNPEGLDRATAGTLGRRSNEMLWS